VARVSTMCSNSSSASATSRCWKFFTIPIGRAFI
jgi:hypothetical protein